MRYGSSLSRHGMSRLMDSYQSIRSIRKHVRWASVGERGEGSGNGRRGAWWGSYGVTSTRIVSVSGGGWSKAARTSSTWVPASSGRVRQKNDRPTSQLSAGARRRRYAATGRSESAPGSVMMSGSPAATRRRTVSAGATCGDPAGTKDGGRVEMNGPVVEAIPNPPTSIPPSMLKRRIRFIT